LQAITASAATQAVGSLWAALARADRVLLSALLVGFLVRVWEFGTLPPGLNQDEASTGYDAYSLLHYGMDRNGFEHPVVLVSWGSGMYALAAYAAMPFIWLFGLDPVSVRLPFLLAGVASIPLFFVLLRNVVDRRTARIGVVLLAISPWHIMASRWALDSNLFPFVFLAATVVAVQSVRGPGWRLLATCALYGLSLYAYGTAYVVVPLFLALLLGYGLVHHWWPRRNVVAGSALFGLVALPVALFVLVNKLQWQSITTSFISIPRLPGVPRFESMGNLNVFSGDFYGNASENLRQGWELLRTQDDGLLWNAIPEYGVLYWFSSALAIVGFVILGRRALRRAPTRTFVLFAWCVVAIALTAFVSVNINRANIVVFPFIFSTAIALSTLWQWRSVAVALCLLYAISFASFTRTYFSDYRERSAGDFFASFGSAVEYASTQTQGAICVTGTVNAPYIFVLFYTREDPRRFAETVVYDNPGAEFQSVSSFGRYAFGLDRCRDTAGVIVATRDEKSSFDPSRYRAEDFERYTVLIRQ
jgi:hypothetical protein